MSSQKLMTTVYVRKGVESKAPNGSSDAPYKRAADYLATLEDPGKSTAKIMVWSKNVYQESSHFLHLDFPYADDWKEIGKSQMKKEIAAAIAMKNKNEQERNSGRWYERFKWH